MLFRVVRPLGQEIDGKSRIGQNLIFLMTYRNSSPQRQNHQKVHIGIRPRLDVAMSRQNDPLRLEFLDDTVA